MKRIVFGDNQFLGINSMSCEKTHVRWDRFSKVESVVEVLDAAYDLGIKTFMCAAHGRIAGVCDYIRANRDRYCDLEFYPYVPYEDEYANALTDLETIERLNRSVSCETSGRATVSTTAVAVGDFVGVLQLLVDAQMKVFSELNTSAIFLHNSATDFLLGCGVREAFVAFAKHIENEYGAEPGFATMNLPTLVPFLEECGIVNPLVCSPINKTGFQMCGGKETCEKVIHKGQFRPMAMRVFASRAVPPEEALEYVCGFENIESVVFGASTKAHIEQNKELIKMLAEKDE